VFDAVLNALSASAWTYLLVMAVVAVDAFFPMVPGDAATITAAILAAQAHLSIVLVVAAAFLGATAGDNLSYFLGNKLGRRAARRLFRGEKSRARLEWARDQLRRRGVTLIIGARFIPGGRTATTFRSGHPRHEVASLHDGRPHRGLRLGAVHGPARLPRRPGVPAQPVAAVIAIARRLRP
jgi:membrane-associated protein